MNKQPATDLLVLACGNRHRSDDGAAPVLAQALIEAGLPLNLRVISRQQWTPELAQDIAAARAVLFVDCALTLNPGEIALLPVEPAPQPASSLSHHLDAAQLLRITRFLYDAAPQVADQLLIGAGSLVYSTRLSLPVQLCLPSAIACANQWILQQSAAPQSGPALEANPHSPATLPPHPSEVLAS